MFGKIRKSVKLASLQSRTKYLAQNREIQSNTGQEKFNNYFYVFFKCYLLKFPEGGMSAGPCLHPSLRFFCFARQLVRQPLHRVCCTWYQVSFYLWWIGPWLMHCTVPKFYKQDYLKIFYFLSTLPMVIEISEKSAILAQKSYFYQKLPISKVESFLKSNFDLRKILLT